MRDIFQNSQSDKEITSQIRSGRGPGRFRSFENFPETITLEIQVYAVLSFSRLFRLFFFYFLPSRFT